MRRVISIVVLLCIFHSFALGQDGKESKELPTVAKKIDGMQKYPGYFNFYWDDAQGKIWLEIDKLDVEFLYVNSLPAGIGSNDIGLDRGQLGDSRIVEFRRVGPKVLLVQPNYDYRAITDNEAERNAVTQAFAESVLWGFEVAAQEAGRALVDASKFLMRDAHNVIGTLKRNGQGNYKLEASKSAFYLPRTKNFPKNTEIEVTLTFDGEPEGRYVRQVVPTPSSITVRQHHSFNQLPDDKYETRDFDPRAGVGNISYLDYATPISQPIVKRVIRRHRLKKKNPSAAVSEAVEPIVYYVDSGAPEPIRSALIEGAKWWNQAFEAIGYKDAFQVKVLPADADPMDLRYNVIQWVHRSTRGWSYGSSVTDPRTGEILKGHVSLGSLRVRQDFLIAEGLLAPYEKGKPVSMEMQEMALARLRQLSAHEVGHTLGLPHNFAASVSNRASVMDYPHPLAKIGSNGSIDLSNAYATDIGEWDKVPIAYAYSDFPAGTDERAKLDGIIRDYFAKGLVFVSDQDARPAGGAHPTAHLWDNGANAAAELHRVMQVRALALQNFSANNIPEHAPMTTLEEVLVPIYLFHRYQVDAASKLLGGLFYTYALRGDGQKVVEIVDPDDQRQSLDALLATLTPEALALPERILNLIPPRAFGYRRSRETFNIRTGLTFDPLAAAETAAQTTVGFIFNAARAARLVEYHSRKSDNPGFVEVADKVLAQTWKSDHGSGYHAEVKRVVDKVVLHNLIALAGNDQAAGQVRAIASFKLRQLQLWLVEQAAASRDEAQVAHNAYAVDVIKRFQEHPGEMDLSAPVRPPAGSPIGTGDIGQAVYRCDWN